MLRVNAVKELADLSRLGDGGAAVGCDVTGEPGPGRSELSGTCQDRGHGAITSRSGESRCVLGGSMMLVEPRHARERRLRPQAGCDIQLPEFTAEPPTKRFCSSAERHQQRDRGELQWVARGHFKAVSCLSKRFVDQVVGAGSAVLDGA